MGRALLRPGARVDEGRARRRRHLPRVPAQEELFDAGWEQSFEGEVSGVVGAGAFVRFRGEMSDAYEGFLPARLVRGDHYELNELDSALIGVRTGRRLGFGDPVEVRIDSLEAPRGRVTLAPGGKEQKKGGRGGKPPRPKGQTRSRGKPKGQSRGRRGATALRRQRQRWAGARPPARARARAGPGASPAARTRASPSARQAGSSREGGADEPQARGRRARARRRHEQGGPPQVRDRRDDGGGDRAARHRGQVPARGKGAPAGFLRGDRGGSALASRRSHPALRPGLAGEPRAGAARRCSCTAGRSSG